MVRINDSSLNGRPAPTKAERTRALEAIARIERRHAEMLAARGGRFFPSAVEVVREIRGDTDEESS